MLPIILKPEYVSALVIGNGVATKRRLEMLERAGVKRVKHVSDWNSRTPEFQNSEVLQKALEGINIVYVADFDNEISAEIAKIVRSKNILLNIEDKGDFCDFHVPAIVRTGDMLVTASTAGNAPRVARRVKRILEVQFDEEFGDKMKIVSEVRNKFKAEGAGIETLVEKSDKVIDEVGLFSKFCERCKGER